MRTRTERFVRLPDAPVVDAEGLNEQLELAGAAGADVPVVGAASVEEVLGLGRKVSDAVTEGRPTGRAVVALGAGADVVAFDVAVGCDGVAVAAASVSVAAAEAVLLFVEAPAA